MIPIENYIPYGYKNRISRETLENITHRKDRTNREEMAEALLNRNVLIVNADNGYFRPDGSAEDAVRAKAYYYQERAKTSSCDKRCKAIWECLKPKTQDDVSQNQLDLRSFGIY